MKINLFRYSIPVGLLVFLVACSTKNNSFLSRNSHALSTQYNILYNGQIGLDKGVESIKSSSNDNFWKRLPIERMQINEELTAEGKTKNQDFELAETKATKAIQKHSMNIDGRERNSQIDEAYLLLGKARYYDQRFIPALDAFNYILYKYPNSSKIYEAKIWREKANMRLGNDAVVVSNMSRLLKDQKLNKQVLADANALLSQAFLNLEEKDSAVAKLKLAEKYTKRNNERARYRFILGQLYEELGKKDSALYSYESVIEMNRKSERKYVIQSQARKAQLFDYQKGDTTAFLKNYNKLIADRENRPFLDLLFYQKAVFYDKNGNQKLASKFYNASLKKATTDEYLIASNYRDLGNLYFKEAKYPIAAKYYDSTLVKLDVKTREFIHIQKIRKDLDEVILYEALASRNDSIINIVSLPEAGRVMYFENFIEKLKKEDEVKRIAEAELQTKLENIERNSKTLSIDPAIANQNPGMSVRKSPLLPPSMTSINQEQNTFYFYNPTTVAFGKVEFKKTWGQRALKGNWRQSSFNPTAISNIASTDTINSTLKSEGDAVAESEQIIDEYTTDFYLKQLPTSQKVIDSIAKERNSAYYQLGVIYKEKFKEYELATNKLEQLLSNNPEEKLILPAMYNLYKIYQITDSVKAEAMRNSINSKYPDSRYAQLINNTTVEEASLVGTPEGIYNKWYKLYEEEKYFAVLEELDGLINQFSADEIVSKFELLKANSIGKLKGLSAYKVALQYLADNYSNTEEGKNAQEILINQIPFLEKMDFNTKDTKNWKILYRVTTKEDNSTKAIEDKIKKFITTNNGQGLKYSFDIYTGKENFITVHGLNSEAHARNIASLLKVNKEYKIEELAVVITNENYKVAQINKNLDAYLASIYK
ncbi:type IX secretion system periplasmic lipoprotein PorW/SprE [Flavobacterium degerlachei]|uniref:Protein involved in gliding motility SprE n=1 Tax=Flavobacterium degerlachei TaxID=229203 RepID=A0A1H2R0V7_9FLAO|nr:gliding motility protein [Flavobacterium degerlachei]SDW12504.1 protein involved in gliding motility SprE [Flavobacterium degerlachei]